MPDSFMLATLNADWAAFALRLTCGLALLPFAIYKVLHFKEMEAKFPEVKPFSKSQALTLALIIENAACVSMIFGLFTRLMCVPAICNMVAAYSADNMGKLRAPADPFITMFAAILIAGPGAFSLDHLIF